MNDPTREQTARRHVEQLTELYVHAAVYAAVNTLLFAIDMLDENAIWFVWPLVGWGIGLTAHAATVLLGGRAREWQDRKVQHLLDEGRV